MLYSDLLGTYYGVCTHVGFATYRRATVKIRLYFMGLMIMWIFCIKKKKKNGSSQQNGIRAVCSRVVRKSGSLGLY
jgi:hypothetical protein